MKFVVSKVKYLLASLLVVVMLSACTSHPDESQIKMLEETKAAALSAEKQLAEKRQARADLEAKCQAKKSELDKVKAEKEMVSQKLQAKKSNM